MKKYISLVIVTLSLIRCASAQNDNIINQKIDLKKGKEIVLVKVLNDSRCPEGVQCIWAGEVAIEVAVYQDNKIIEQEQLTFTPHNQKEMVSWFTERLPKTEKNLKSVGVLPYPKDGVSRKLEDYFIKLNY